MTEKYDLVFIEHILDSINAIEEFSRGVTKEEIIKNRLKQSAIIREIEVIGEAAKNVSKSLKSKWKEVEWSNIAGTRDKMIHHKNRHAVGAPDLQKVGLECLDRNGVEIRKGLVHNEKIGRYSERACEADALALSA